MTTEQQKNRDKLLTEYLQFAKDAPDGSLFVPPANSSFLPYGKIDGEWFLIGSMEDFNLSAGYGGAAGFAASHGFTIYNATQ
jgi:hypothetical protein